MKAEYKAHVYRTKARSDSRYYWAWDLYGPDAEHLVKGSATTEWGAWRNVRKALRKHERNTHSEWRVLHGEEQ